MEVTQRACEDGRAPFSLAQPVWWLMLPVGSRIADIQPTDPTGPATPLNVILPTCIKALGSHTPNRENLDIQSESRPVLLIPIPSHELTQPHTL